MLPNLLSGFGDKRDRVKQALNSLRNGQGVIVTDDENRENEGDLVFAAESITIPHINMMIRNCSGIVCLCLPQEKIKSLQLPMMVNQNTSRYGTAFTVSIDAARGITTGVSAYDRVVTVQTAISDNACPEDLSRPGHMFPLAACDGGVLQRRGHTEATVDLPKMAGLKPYGLLCELMNPDGTMSRMPEIIDFARKNDLPVVTVEDIVDFRKTT